MLAPALAEDLTVGRLGRPIHYAPRSLVPHLGMGAPAPEQIYAAAPAPRAKKPKPIAASKRKRTTQGPGPVKRSKHVTVQVSATSPSDTPSPLRAVATTQATSSANPQTDDPPVEEQADNLAANVQDIPSPVPHQAHPSTGVLHAPRAASPAVGQDSTPIIEQAAPLNEAPSVTPAADVTATPPSAQVERVEGAQHEAAAGADDADTSAADALAVLSERQVISVPSSDGESTEPAELTPPTATVAQAQPSALPLGTSPSADADLLTQPVVGPQVADPITRDAAIIPSDNSSSSESESGAATGQALSAVSFTLSAAEIFDFDISQYIGQSATSAERSPQQNLADDIKRQLSALLPFLRQPIEDLTKNSEPVRSVFQKIEDALPEDLVDALNAASYLESHRLTVQRARQRIASRSEQKKTATSLTLHKSMAVNHKNTLDALLAKPSELKDELTRLKEEAADLERALAAKRRAIEEKERELNDLPAEVERQKALLSSAIQDTMKLAKSSKPIPGTDADDLAAIDKIDNIRRHALDLLSKYLD